MTTVLTEGQILCQPLDGKVFYRDHLPRPFIRIHKIMPQMLDILPLENRLEPVDGGLFWHWLTPGGAFHKPPSSPAAGLQPAKAAVPSFSFALAGKKPKQPTNRYRPSRKITSKNASNAPSYIASAKQILATYSRMKAMCRGLVTPSVWRCISRE